MTVHVDETRCDRKAGAFDMFRSVGRSAIADACDHSVLESDICAVCGRPGTIDDETTAKNDVKHDIGPISATGLATALSGTTYIDITRGRFLARSISLPLLP